MVKAGIKVWSFAVVSLLLAGPAVCDEINEATINNVDSLPTAKSPSSGDGLSTFDDSVYYKIKWPEAAEKLKDELPTPTPEKIPEENENVVWVTTAQKETYYCLIPTNLQKGEGIDDSKNAFEGISPYQILKPLFTREVCSYRLEQYWTYELCHGRWVRQFHEESTVQKVKGQEYYLGKFDIATLEAAEETFNDKLKQLEADGRKRPTIVVDGAQLPYIEFNMTDGTLCDLNQKMRSTRVLYVCSEDSKHELHSIKETHTCEYEAVVLSPLLCLHSDFKVNVARENDISCHPVGNSPGKPTGLTEIETRMRREKKPENIFDGKTIIIDAAELSGKDSAFSGLDLNLIIHDEDGNILKRKTIKNPLGDPLPPKPKQELKVLKEFLSGNMCLQTGTGWWKYEFCYGHKVVQFHEDKGRRSATITLGVWDKDVHRQWLTKNPNKKVRPDKTSRQVSHFYGNGEICGETRRPRQVEIKLKCKYSEENTESFSMYMREPKTCEYILAIEAPFICNIISSADADGFMQITEEVEDALSA